MCLSCACGEPNSKHGDDRHITQSDIEAAAKAADIKPEQVVKNIADGMKAAGSTAKGSAKK